jgi:ribonuclease H2 subunit B
VTPELTVYRYSEDKVMEYLQAKVSRLSKHAVAEKSRTIIRGLARDGLMDDGKEDLLERKWSSWSWHGVVEPSPS